MEPADKPLAKPRRPALLAGSAAVAGCSLAQLAGAGWVTALAAGLALPFAAVALLLATRKSFRAAAALSGVAVACVFTAWCGARQSMAPDNLLSHFPGDAELARIEGVVIEGGDYMTRDPAAFEYPESPEPEPGFPIGADPRRSTSYILRVERLPDLDQEASGLVKLYVQPGTELELHSRVSLLGKLRRPRDARNPGEIDSRARYEARGITHTLTLKEGAEVTSIEPVSGQDPRRFAPWVHERFHVLIGSRMPRERAAVLGATILGERGNLTPAQRAKFVRSGTIHVLVVSGMHVALLAGVVLLVLRAFGMDPRKAWAFAAAACLLYLLITGLQPSMLRATVMVVIYALGKMLVRRPDALNVLGASALVSLAISPTDVADLGFQLSYLCVLGILVVAPCLRLIKPLTDSQRMTRGPLQSVGDWLGASLRISLAVGLCTWPLLAYTVHVVSPSMLVTNLLVGPLLSAILGLALLAPLGVVPFIAAALAWALSLLAGLLELLAGTFAELPFGHVFTPAPPLWWLWGYYVALVLLVAGPRMRLPRMAGALCWLVWLCLLPALTLVQTEEPGPARVTALDVGQGQCVVFEVSGGPCAVLDCGSTSLGGVGERVLAPYLWQRGRRHIDVLFISHADADHVNGLPQLFERFGVGRVYVPETFGDDETGTALLAWLERYAPVAVLHRGEEVKLADGLTLRCLWPDAAFVRGALADGEQRNEGGLVLELDAGELRVLLPSDVEAAGLAGVTPHLHGEAHVLFAPHQGSDVDGLENLLKRLRPRHVVVSAREAFPSDTAMEAYESSGAEVWPTWRTGALTMLLGADGSLEVTPHAEE